MNEFEILKSKYIKQLTQDIPEDLDDVIEEVSSFQIYPNIKQYKINWSNENNDLMANVGLPSSAPSMLDFRSIMESEADSNYIDIGFNNYGDKIVIIRGSGEIAYINHDSNNQIEFMNSDAISLFKCICKFADMIKGNTEYPSAIREIDPQAYEDGRWWKQEYLGWLNK